MGLFGKKQPELALSVVENKPELPSIRYVAGTGGKVVVDQRGSLFKPAPVQV